MINYSAEQLSALKGPVKIIYLISFSIGATNFYFNNSDSEISYQSKDYTPGLFDGVADIEITSDPRVNDNEFEFNDASGLISDYLLTEKWMNKDFKIIKLILDENGAEIISKIAFEGLISDIEIDVEKSTVNITVSSIWSDYEKTSGIKTNSTSQKIHYPLDTAFEHSSNAKNKTYWGRSSLHKSFYDTGGTFIDDPIGYEK